MDSSWDECILWRLFYCYAKRNSEISPIKQMCLEKSWNKPIVCTHLIPNVRLSTFGYWWINEHLLKISLRNHCWKNIFVVAIVIPKMWVCTRNTSIKNDALYLFSFFKFYLLWYKYFSRWKNMNYFSLLLFAFNCFLVIILLYGFLRCWFFHDYEIYELELVSCFSFRIAVRFTRSEIQMSMQIKN